MNILLVVMNIYKKKYVQVNCLFFGRYLNNNVSEKIIIRGCCVHPVNLLDIFVGKLNFLFFATL